jgi:hypothetical protein
LGLKDDCVVYFILLLFAPLFSTFMVQIVNVLKTSLKAATGWARYVNLTRFNTRIPAMTPSVKVDSSRLAAAKPNANQIPAEYEKTIATLLATDKTRRFLWFSLV